MSDVTTALSPGQASKLAVLLDALDGVAISDAERASLARLAGLEAHTVDNVAAVTNRARRSRLDGQPRSTGKIGREGVSAAAFCK